MTGSAFADTLTGDASANMLSGAAGNGTLTGRGRHDRIDGGAGLDTARFSGTRAAYSLVRLVDHSVRVAGPDGIDRVTTVERLQFDDGAYAVPSTLFVPAAIKASSSFGASPAGGG